MTHRKSSKKKKSVILDEFCAAAGYNRKYAIFLIYTFKRFTRPKPKKRGRPSKYNCPEVLRALRRIRLAANLPCSKRLKAILPWLPFYHREYGHLSVPVVKLLLKISAPTIDCILKPFKTKYKTKGRCAATRGEQRAVFGKGETAVLEQTKDVENMLPFKLLGFDCDNAHIEQKNWTQIRQWLGYSRFGNPDVE